MPAGDHNDDADRDAYLFRRRSDKSGSRNLGETLGTSVCGPFTPSQRVNFTFNGLAAGGKNANADGSVPVAITILSANSANVEDIVPTTCGQTNPLRLTDRAVVL